MTPLRLALAGGVTRAVLLAGKYAIKVPRVRFGWAKLLYGLLSNMTEAQFSPLAEDFRLCPTVFSLPGGLLIIQRRCDPLTDEQWDMIRCNDEDVHGRADWFGMDCDFKRDNFGVLDGRIVLFDFGERT